MEGEGGREREYVHNTEAREKSMYKKSIREIQTPYDLFTKATKAVQQSSDCNKKQAHRYRGQHSGYQLGEGRREGKEGEGIKG